VAEHCNCREAYFDCAFQLSSSTKIRLQLVPSLQEVCVFDLQVFVLCCQPSLACFLGFSVVCCSAVLLLQKKRYTMHSVLTNQVHSQLALTDLLCSACLEQCTAQCPQPIYCSRPIKNMFVSTGFPWLPDKEQQAFEAAAAAASAPTNCCSPSCCQSQINGISWGTAFAAAKYTA